MPVNLLAWKFIDLKDGEKQKSIQADYQLVSSLSGQING